MSFLQLRVRNGDENNFRKTSYQVFFLFTMNWNLEINRAATKRNTRVKPPQSGWFEAGELRDSEGKHLEMEREKERQENIEPNGFSFLHHCDKQASPCPVKRGNALLTPEGLPPFSHWLNGRN